MALQSDEYSIVFLHHDLCSKYKEVWLYLYVLVGRLMQQWLHFG